jgi:ribosomal protein S18 acetylase RimI-like enzyme
VNLVIRKASEDDFPLLADMDRKIFGKDGAFSVEDFEDYLNFLVSLDNHAIGSMMLLHNRGVAKTFDDEAPHMAGSLYIRSTALLFNFQRVGLGSILKAWQIAYARRGEFNRIVTNARISNKGSITLNKKFNFKIIGIRPNYYRGPEESALVLELKL